MTVSGICFPSNFYSKISKHMLTDDGKVIDWKREFKLKKLEGIKKAQRINELSKLCDTLQKDNEVKERTIQKMADMGLTEYVQKDRKELKLKLLDQSKLEVDIREATKKIKDLEECLRAKKETIDEYLEENKKLKNQNIDLYNKLKNGENQSSIDTANIESLLSQEHDAEINRLNHKIASSEREKSELLSKFTLKQNDYETMVQKNNTITNELETIKHEEKRLRSQIDSLREVVNQKDKRIQELTTERSNLNTRLQELQLKYVEEQYSKVTQDMIESLQNENALFKQILGKSQVSPDPKPAEDLANLQKLVEDKTNEIDSLNQKIYNYKQMLKEYEILLSIFKEQVKEEHPLDSLNRAIDLNDIQIEDLMSKVKIHIQHCIQKVKTSFVSHSKIPVSEQTENRMLQRVNELDTEKENLLKVLAEQEASYKECLQTTQDEVEKLKELLRSTKETKSQLEAKLQQANSALLESNKTIETLKEQGIHIIKEFEEKLHKKDGVLHQNSEKIVDFQRQIESLEMANLREKEDLEKQREQVRNDIFNNQNEIKSLRNQIVVAEERLKLKEQEIYEIKENYEAQLEDLVTEEKQSLDQSMIRIIPTATTGVSRKASSSSLSKTPDSKKDEEEARKYAIKCRSLQDKIHNITDKLFSVRDTLLEKETEIIALKDEIKKKEINENNILSELELLKANRQSTESQLLNSNQLKNELQAKVMALEKTYTTETTELKKQLEEAAKMADLLKSEIKSKRTSLKSTDVSNSDLNRLVSKMLAMLRKSKKIIELKDGEIENIKQQLLSNLSHEE